MPQRRHTALASSSTELAGSELATHELAELAERVAELEAINTELARSNDELAEFAFIASHELRAPLQTIGGFAELLADHVGDSLDTEAAEHLDDIRRGTDRLRILVDSLLAYARVGTGVRRREDVDCEAVVSACADDLRSRIAETGATLSCGPLPTVVADPDEMAVVFGNLLANALRFGRPGVALEVEVSATRVGQSWRFAVGDNGIGIEPSHRERVFRVFQRAPGQSCGSGSGIGLAVCRRIVEGHGGRIWAEEGASGGARLFFTIPAPVCWSPFG